MQSQNKQILAHLKKGNKITPLQALNKFDCFRLAARMANLKDAGHKIDSKMITRNNKRFKQYWLC